MVLGFIIITFFYLILIGSFIIGFDKVKEFIPENLTETTKFSIIIPFRNEAENLLNLLQSLYKLDYPHQKFEVLLVDDDSTDNSVEIIQNFIETKLSKKDSTLIDIKIVKNNRKSNSPKKDAITTAILIAQHDWIIATDADCIVPTTWLKTIDSFIQTNNPKMVVAPVTYAIKNSFLSQFQLLDFLSLQSATIAGFGIKKPFLCNGANLCYRKDLFKTLNGFDGNETIASGDDIFLMEKAIRAYPNDVLCLKSIKALVFTESQPSLKELIQQRLRWAAKTSAYTNIFGKVVGLIVLFMNAIIVITFVLTLFGEFRLEYLLLLFTLKFIFDLLLISKSSRLFNQKLHLMSYFSSSLLYPFFSVYIAFYSLFFGFKWKERRFKK